MPTITRATSPYSIEYLKDQANDEDATTLVFEHDCLTSAYWQNAKVNPDSPRFNFFLSNS
jgi:hypothetical protein